MLDYDLKGQMHQAGSPDVFSFFHLNTVPSTIPQCADLKKILVGEVDPPRLNGHSLLLHGDCREETGFSLLAWFLTLGYRGKTIQLETLTDFFIAKQRTEYKDVREAPFLLLFFGREMISSVHKTLLTYLADFRHHQGYFTAFVSDRPIADLTRFYGKEVYTLITDPSRIRSVDCGSLRKVLDKITIRSWE